MILENLGYNEQIGNYRKENNLDRFDLGRVSQEHRDRYTIITEAGECEGELLGNLRFTAESRDDLPAVGDWVAINKYDEGKVLIHAVYPRTSVIERQAAGSTSQRQIIATNIDYGLIVQAVDRDFNINRLERYLTICHSGGVEPVIVLSKIDLIEKDKLEALVARIEERIHDTDIIPISSETEEGYVVFRQFLMRGKTYCLLGSSGVGKSTLINHLARTELMETSAISTSVGKGKHTTTHRELIVLPSGGIIIDNPGMREIGITENQSGLELTFDDIVALTEECRFKDCNHIDTEGCAVIEAVDSGKIDPDHYQNFIKMLKERAFFESSIAERRANDRKFGKIIKQILEEKKRSKR